MSLNTFGHATSLTVGSETVRYLQSAGARTGGIRRRRAAAVFAEDPAREPAAPRGQRVRPRRRHPRAGRPGRPTRPTSERFRSCRRACCCRTSPACRASSIWRRCATGSPRSAAIPSASIRCSRSSSSSITRCRSITSAGPMRSQLNARSRVPAQSRALRVPAVGTDGLPQLPRRAAGDRHRPSGQHRVPRARRLPRRRRAAGAVAYPGHGVRHRLAHDDGQRTRRGRMGRRRHRSRGGDARPAELDADSAGRRIPAVGPAARRRDRDRPRADDHRGAAQEGRRRRRSSSSTDRACGT